VVPDTGPVVYITAPADGAAVTEGNEYDIKVGTKDDVGVAQMSLVRSSEQVILTDANTNAMF